jgi:hypothetical protein
VAFLAAALLACGAGARLGAQIRVNPDGVNVNSQGATTVFLTFGGLAGHVPVDAFWCGELIPADPDVGLKCDPSTIFGRLPLRYDQSRLAANRFTDIMSIPPSVARRAYQAAEAGQTSSFFYVRRFESTTGGPDEFVPVTCRMAGGGARVPFSLVDVRIEFDVDAPILFLQPGQVAPPVAAEITYNGTGRLKGRWEVVLPGEELPTERDLLTEATLPPEERGTQRRYTQLERFNVFLPPGGRTVLAGPDPAGIPTVTEGLHLILLRVEATDDKEGDSNLASAGAGTGVVHSGAAAGFPLPTLRYVVGSGGSELALRQGEEELLLLLPAERAALPGGPFDFTWAEVRGAAYYRLEVRGADGGEVLSAIVPAGAAAYRTPPWLADRAAGGELSWRVAALDLRGEEIRESAWRRFTIRGDAPVETPDDVPAPGTSAGPGG